MIMGVSAVGGVRILIHKETKKSPAKYGLLGKVAEEFGPACTYYTIRISVMIGSPPSFSSPY